MSMTETNKTANDLKNVVKDVDKEVFDNSKGRVPIWPAFIAFATIGVLFSLLSEKLTIGPTWVMLVILAALLVVAIIGWLGYRHRFSRSLGRLMTGLVTLVLAVGVFLLVASLPGHTIAGAALLRDAAILWISNVIIFGLWYWELDGGGPASRHIHGYTATDFLFPQIVIGEPFSRDWSPSFIDYLYLAFNTNTAFSPTDTMVLSGRAKVLMMVQSLLALVTIAVIAARAINIIPNGG